MFGIQTLSNRSPYIFIIISCQDLSKYQEQDSLILPIIVEICLEYLRIFLNLFFLQAAILSSPNGQRALSSGRVVTVNTAEHKNALAVILRTANVSAQGYSTVQSQLVSSPKEKKFEVLVICDPEDQRSGERINSLIENDCRQVVFTTIIG